MGASGDNGKAGKGSGGLIALVVLTLIAAGAGAAHGLQTFTAFLGAGGAKHEAAAETSAKPAPAHGEAAPAHGAAPAAAAPVKLPSKIVTRDLAPVITNIVMPPDMWVRLEATIIYDQAEVSNPEVTMTEISGDILGFLRSMTLRELQGADGLMFLRQDLKERVLLRTQGKVRDFVIQALVVQ